MLRYSSKTIAGENYLQKFCFGVDTEAGNGEKLAGIVDIDRSWRKPCI
jgi:hypothetical protein